MRGQGCYPIRDLFPKAPTLVAIRECRRCCDILGLPYPRWAS